MPESRKVLFVCQHGAAKSVVAAHHLQRLARERGLELECQAAGLEPYESVPVSVVKGLEHDGFNAIRSVPQRVTADMLQDADAVVSFGCDLSGLPVPDSLVNWEGVPHVSDDFEAARDEITRRLIALVEDLQSRQI